jgi:uncharacterized protein YqjF (DUF2071 family)
MAKFLTAEWRRLLMAQYAVEPELLTPWLPHGVELDLFAGRCYVSLVGFLFDRVHVKGVPIPFHTRFEEVNLRFYVRRTEADGSVRRGVVFVREFVPRSAIAFVAQRFYEEPYLAMPTRHEFAAQDGLLRVGYGWKYGGRWHSLAALAGNELVDIAAGSEEEFITEHYWGYTKRSDGSTSAYQVEHPRWQVRKLHSYEIAADFGVLYGPEFAFLNDHPVSSVLLAEGSAVTVYAGAKLQP